MARNIVGIDPGQQYVDSVKGEASGLASLNASSKVIQDPATSFLPTAGGTMTGNLAFASGQGIDFSATSNAAGMTSELLDDYEEGTWTPAFATGTTSNAQGFYRKVGDTVFLWGGLTADDTTSSNGLQISGIPFAASRTNTNLQLVEAYDLGSVGFRFFSDVGYAYWAYFHAPLTLQIAASVNADASVLVAHSGASAGNRVGFQITYRT